jgi:TP901 family phage tail tape measure protein
MNREIEARLKISAIDKTGRVFKTVADKIGTVDHRAQQYNRTQMAIARTTEGVMLSMARFAGPAAIGAGLIYATKSAADFEQSLFNIEKKSGATKKQMAELRGEIMQLSQEVPVSIDEIASAFERGAAAGVPLDELKQFSKLTAGVADAWDTTAENVGNTFAGFVAGMGMTRGDLQAYASLINDLADSGIADETAIADFIDRAGASLHNFGMTPEEIAAYGAALLNLKMPAEVGARAMDTIAGKLMAPENLSPKALQGLKGVVGSLTEFGKLSGNARMMFFLNKLSQMSAQRRVSLLGAMLGEGFDDEIARLVNGLPELTRNLDMAAKHAANPSNSIVATQEKKVELFNSQLVLLKNNLQGIVTSMGEKAILPWLTDAMKQVNDAIAELDARKRTGEGMGLEERIQTQKQFIQRWREDNPDSGRDWPMQAHREYLKAQAAVGRGEYRSVEDYLTRQSEGRAYNARVSGAAAQYQQYGEGRALVNNVPEFPGGGHGYTPKNLPNEGAPVPGQRPLVPDARYQSMRDQYEAYAGAYVNNAQSGMPAEILSQKVKDALAGGATPGVSTGSSVADMFGGAAKEIADGGQEGAGYFSQAADSIRQAGNAAADAIRIAVQDGIRSIQGARSAGNAVGRMVNADTGRSMPPSTFGPAGGN